MVFDGTQRADITTFTASAVKSREYHFKLQAINFVGVSQFSPILTCKAAVVPSTPQVFSIVESDESQVLVQWEVPAEDGGAPLTGYYVYYR